VIILPEADYFGNLYWSSEPVLLSTSRELSSDSLHHVRPQTTIFVACLFSKFTTTTCK